MKCNNCQYEWDYTPRDETNKRKYVTCPKCSANVDTGVQIGEKKESVELTCSMCKKTWHFKGKSVIKLKLGYNVAVTCPSCKTARTYQFIVGDYLTCPFCNNVTKLFADDKRDVCGNCKRFIPQEKQVITNYPPPA